MGPKIVTDGLVLSYDVADTKNSFLGEPSTNLANNLSSMGPANNYIPVNTVAHSGIVQVSTDVIQPPVAGMTVWKISNSDPDGYSRFGIGQSGNVTIASFGTYDVTYVASIYVYIPSGVVMSGATDCWATQNSTGVDWHTGNNPTLNASGYYSGDINTLNSVANLNIRDKWQRIFVRFTTSSTVRAYGGTDNCKYLTVQFRPNLVGTNGSSFIYVSSFQLEQKSYPTTFTTLTRSNTGGLINLSNPSSTLNLSNATFGSDGTLSFNGSTSYVGVSNNILSSNSPYTLLAFLKPNGSNWGDNSMPLFNTYYADLGFWHHFGLDNGLAYRHYGSTSAAGTLSSIGLVANVWQMTAVTWDGSNIKLYKNATLQSSAALAAGYTVNSGGRIGMLNARSVSSDYNWNGLIDIQMIYNRALSNNELIQTFNMYRNRFGI
jgi:hypothetical protein